MRLEPYILRDRQNSPKKIRDANLTFHLGHTVFPITQQRPRPLHALTAQFPERSKCRDLTEVERTDCMLSARRQSGAYSWRLLSTEIVPVVGLSRKGL